MRLFAFARRFCSTPVLGLLTSFRVFQCSCLADPDAPWPPTGVLTALNAIGTPLSCSLAGSSCYCTTCRLRFAALNLTTVVSTALAFLVIIFCLRLRTTNMSHESEGSTMDIDETLASSAAAMDVDGSAAASGLPFPGEVIDGKIQVRYLNM